MISTQHSATDPVLSCLLDRMIALSVTPKEQRETARFLRRLTRKFKAAEKAHKLKAFSI